MLRWLAPLVILGLVAAAPARPERELGTRAIQAAKLTSKVAARRIGVSVERHAASSAPVFVVTAAIDIAHRAVVARIDTRVERPVVVEPVAVHAAARGPPSGAAA